MKLTRPAQAMDARSLAPVLDGRIGGWVREWLDPLIGGVRARWADPFAVRRTYTAEELDAFERLMGVVLPEAYRAYLLRIGAGNRISLLEDWGQPHSPGELPGDFLSQPFPFREAWNDLALKDPALGWSAAYYDPLLFRGSMRIANLGCEGYDLLVISGPERGTVWCDHRADYSNGIHPLARHGQSRVTISEYLA